MRKRYFVYFIIAFCSLPALAATKSKADRFINKSLYENVYPSTLNSVREIPLIGPQNKTDATAGNTASAPAMGKRRVIKRTTNARAATANGINDSRRVVSRSATPNRGDVNMARNIGRASNNTASRGAITKTTVRYKTSTSDTTNSGKTSSQRCFADYKECMESYCQREDTAYNRCYCSAKLAQIDSKYQNKIDKLIQQIIKLKYNTNTTDEEIAEYWDYTVGTYTETNPWVNIDNALNIDWADTESRVRGQNAFATGHSYCVAYLRGCSYMANNLRDAYKSEIARDCESYEKSLQKIQAAAESVIENYND